MTRGIEVILEVTDVRDSGREDQFVMEAKLVSSTTHEAEVMFEVSRYKKDEYEYEVIKIDGEIPKDVYGLPVLGYQFLMCGAVIPQKGDRIEVYPDGWPTIRRNGKVVSSDHYDEEAGEWTDFALFDPGEEGQGMIEYLLLLTLMAVVVVVLAGSLGQSIKELYSQVVSAMP